MNLAINVYMDVEELFSGVRMCQLFRTKERRLGSKEGERVNVEYALKMAGNLDYGVLDC